MRALLITMSLALAACASSAPHSATETPDRPSSFDAREFRQPAIFVRVDVRTAQLSTRDASEAPAEYQGLLLEGLNAKAVVPRDVTVVAERDALDRRAAVARAREVGADHALLVDVALLRKATPFCRGAFTADTLTVIQKVLVVRANDEAVRWQPVQIETSSFDADCRNPRESKRQSRIETMQTAVNRLLSGLLGS